MKKSRWLEQDNESGQLVIPAGLSRKMGDCFGNASPTCGGGLWAQGIIQCP